LLCALLVVRLVDAHGVNPHDTFLIRATKVLEGFEEMLRDLKW
jgi:hypothetical protein